MDIKKILNYKNHVNLIICDKNIDTYEYFKNIMNQIYPENKLILDTYNNIKYSKSKSYYAFNCINLQYDIIDFINLCFSNFEINTRDETSTIERIIKKSKK